MMTLKKSVLMIGCVVTLALLTCMSTGCSKEVKVNDSDVELISRAEFQDALADIAKEEQKGKRSNTLLIDPRTSYHYESGHIDGAINIPLNEIAKGDARLEGYSKILVYGERGEDPRAKAMCKKILSYGHKDVRMYIGGLIDWRSQDLPLVNERNN